MKRQRIYIIVALLFCLLAGAGIVMAIKDWDEARHIPQVNNTGVKTARKTQQPKATPKKNTQKKTAAPQKADYTVSGILRDEEGMPVGDVIVSDGYTCVKTDASGRYSFKRDSLARFIYYSVPAYCEVPVHSESCRTALFYQSVEAGKKTYDFTLRRLPGGKEKVTA